MTFADQQRFADLSQQLSIYRLDPTLQITKEDPIVNMVKEDIQARYHILADSNDKTQLPSDLPQQIETILDDIFKKKK